MKALHTKSAPAAIGPYSQAIEVNGFVFASGQIPIDPATGEFVEGGIKDPSGVDKCRPYHGGSRHRLVACGQDYGLFGRYGRFCRYERSIFHFL